MPRLRQWQKVIKMPRGNYFVIYADELGQVSIFDTHGRVVQCVLTTGTPRELRLEDIIHRKAFERLSGR